MRHCCLCLVVMSVKSLPDVYETLLPLFGSDGGQSYAAPNEANIQPM